MALFFVAAARFGGASGPGFLALGRRRLDGLDEQGGKLVETVLAIAALGAEALRLHHQQAVAAEAGGEFFGDPLALKRAEGLAAGKVVMQFNAGAELVDILPARPRTAAEFEAQFRERNLDDWRDVERFHNCKSGVRCL